ncbi:MAG: hypothetical protein N3A38_01315 [Planctomycetota bacterium]|nr:hypothetical protein [Planctomycetota bacterium]
MSIGRLARWCAIGIATAAVAASQQGCRVTVHGRAHVVGWYWGCPHYRLVRIEGTGIHYIADVEDDIFYYAGGWYRFHSGAWYHTRVYGGAWVRIPAPPAVFIRIPPGHAKARVCPAPAVSVTWRWGHPQYRLAVIPGTTIQYVLDADDDIFFFDNVWYRFSAGVWYECHVYGGTWVQIPGPPAVFFRIPDDHPKARVKLKPPPPPPPHPPPAKWVWGRPGYRLVAIPGTTIQYIADVDEDIFFSGGVWYRFDAGVWYECRTYGGAWVRISAPPIAFAAIPDGHIKVHVRSKLPAHPPPGPWRWGHPSYKLAIIPGTSIQYVVDVDDDIFCFGGVWYRFHAGVWYQSHRYGGEWIKISAPPAVFLSIPDGHPKSRVKPRPSPDQHSRHDRAPEAHDRGRKGEGRPPEDSPGVEPPKNMPPREPGGKDKDIERSKDREPDRGDAIPDRKERGPERDSDADKGKGKDKDRGEDRDKGEGRDKDRGRRFNGPSKG